MNITLKTVLFAAVVTVLAGIAGAETPKSDPAAPAAAATIKQIEKEMGFVPDFIRAIPASLLPSFWASAEQFSMNPTTALDGKTKELIGLAVAAQIPCDYCVIFHTEAARLNGASETEIREAVGAASLTRQASTLLNGLQVDKAQFKKDIARIVKSARDAQAHK